jgi:hypothetical protein
MIFSSSFYPLFNVVVVYEVISVSRNHFIQQQLHFSIDRIPVSDLLKNKVRASVRKNGIIIKY